MSLILFSTIFDIVVMLKNIRAKKYLKPMYDWCNEHEKTPEEYITILENLNKTMKINIKEIKKNENK